MANHPLLRRAATASTFFRSHSPKSAPFADAVGGSSKYLGRRLGSLRYQTERVVAQVFNSVLSEVEKSHKAATKLMDDADDLKTRIDSSRDSFQDLSSVSAESLTCIDISTPESDDRLFSKYEPTTNLAVGYDSLCDPITADQIEQKHERRMTEDPSCEHQSITGVVHFEPDPLLDGCGVVVLSDAGDSSEAGVASPSVVEAASDPQPVRIGAKNRIRPSVKEYLRVKTIISPYVFGRSGKERH